MKKNIFENNPKKTIFFIILIFSSLLFLILEIISYPIISSFLDNPEKIKFSKTTKPIIKKLYMRYDRNIIQYLDYAAQYDPELMYILKPGNFIVKNREHIVKYNINSLGFRDDEKSLSKPPIIVLGDSFAMGWGVQQDETFAQLVEKKLKVSVLNTGVSSYGTVRETIALRRVDTSNLKYLVIQYCPNDHNENNQYVNNNYRIHISSKNSYSDIVKKHMNRDSRPYFSVRIIAKIILNKIFSKPLKEIFRKKERKKRNEAKEAENFLKILERMNLYNVQIIVFELNGNNQNDSFFIENVENLITKNKYPDFIRKIKTIQVDKILTDNDYFIIDDHINKNGHRKVANAIVKAINN